MSRTPESMIYQVMGRNPGRHHAMQFESYDEIYNDYYNIYSDYLLNLLISEFKYENTPITFNERALEWMLRMIGWANVLAVDNENIVVEGVGDGGLGINTELGSLFTNTSVNDMGKFAKDMLGNKKPTILTGFNTDTAKLPVMITMSNKLNYYSTTNISDMTIVDRTARTLAEIKASEITNIRQQKTPFIGFTRDGSLTAKSVWQQLQSGKPFISVDKDMLGKDGNINNLISVVPTQTPNLAPTLKDSWNDTMNEFLTFMGLDSMAVDKKERLVTAEAESNDQQVSISASIYLDARNKQLSLLNKKLGTSIYVKMNFDTLEDTLELINQTAPKESSDENDMGQLDNQNKQD